MKSMILTVVCICASIVVCAAQPEPARPHASKPDQRYLVEMNCAPDDRDAVTSTLQMALALREDQSAVSLFIDLQAVHLATPQSKSQQVELQRETDKLFDKLRSKGVTVLVCPHCAKEHGIAAKSLRAGLRFTSKEELDSERKGASTIFEYRPKIKGPTDVAVKEDKST